MIIGSRNKVQSYNYGLVILSKRKAMKGEHLYTEGESVIGYSYKTNGRYMMHFLGRDYSNIAKFIYSSDCDKMICNTSDCAIASTKGIHLDVAVEPFLSKIQPYLEKEQKKYEKSGEYSSFNDICW